MKKIKMLFLCSGNSARSQIAEAFLRNYAGDKFESYSAGIEAKGIHPSTIKVMNEIGLSLDGHRSKEFKEYMEKKKFDYLVTVCAETDKQCPGVFPGVTKRMHWPFDDPAQATGSEEERIRKFREVRDQIDNRIKKWLAEFDVVKEKKH